MFKLIYERTQTVILSNVLCTRGIYDIMTVKQTFGIDFKQAFILMKQSTIDGDHNEIIYGLNASIFKVYGTILFIETTMVLG